MNAWYAEGFPLGAPEHDNSEQKSLPRRCGAAAHAMIESMRRAPVSNRLGELAVGMRMQMALLPARLILFWEGCVVSMHEIDGTGLSAAHARYTHFMMLGRTQAQPPSSAPQPLPSPELPPES